MCCPHLDILEACRLGREILDLASRALKPGVTGDFLDRVVYHACCELAHRCMSLSSFVHRAVASVASGAAASGAAWASAATGAAASGPLAPAGAAGLPHPPANTLPNHNALNMSQPTSIVKSTSGRL